MKTLTQNAAVIFFDAAGKQHKGVITEVLAQNPGGGTARIDYTERKKNAEGKDIAAQEDQSLGHHTAIAEYSEEKKPLTFHFAATAAEKSSANGASATASK